MSVFVDASALVAIVKNEPEASDFISAIEAERTRLPSGLAMWEAVRAVGKASHDLAEAWRLCERFRVDFGIEIVGIGAAEMTGAIEVHGKYGKGTGHPARLNMGDCFAYACARTNRARLLYQGNDFIHTDLGR